MSTTRCVVLVIMLSLAGCVADEVLTQQEMLRQSAADYQVASLLFEQELSAHASYKVSKTAFVNIVFDKSVPFSRYDNIVRSLRTNKAISGVRAEQEGVEVCPLR